MTPMGPNKDPSSKPQEGQSRQEFVVRYRYESATAASPSRPTHSMVAHGHNNVATNMECCLSVVAWHSAKVQRENKAAKAMYKKKSCCYCWHVVTVDVKKERQQQQLPTDFGSMMLHHHCGRESDSAVTELWLILFPHRLRLASRTSRRNCLAAPARLRHAMESDRPHIYQEIPSSPGAFPAEDSPILAAKLVSHSSYDRKCMHACKTKRAETYQSRQQGSRFRMILSIVKGRVGLF